MLAREKERLISIRASAVLFPTSFRRDKAGVGEFRRNIPGAASARVKS